LTKGFVIGEKFECRIDGHHRQDSWDLRAVQAVNEKCASASGPGWLLVSRSQHQSGAPKLYRHSAEFRARFNGCPFHEPTNRST
jgi:hypothetical protein